MSRFYISSLIVHIFALFFLFKVIDVKEKPPKLVQKRNMAVSVRNQRARSSNVKVNKNKSKEKQAKEKKKEEIIKDLNHKKKKKIKKVKKIKKYVKKKTEKKQKKIVENIEDKKVIVQKIKTVYNEFEDKNRFTLGDDGVFTAVISDGIEFEIIKEIDPHYPIIATKMGYKGKGEVVVEFLVDLNGHIQDIEFISGESRYGFKEEVVKALKQWRFKPIIYKGKKIKVNFEKTFIFK